MPYFIKRDEKVNGPFTAAKVESAAKSGKLKETDLISSSREGPWEQLGAVLRSKNPPPIPQTEVERTDFEDDDVAAWLAEGEDADSNTTASSNQSVVNTGPPPLPTSVGSPNETDDPVASTKNQSGSSKPTKDCPFCAEPIAVAAIKCKHCGEMLDGNFTPAQASQQPRKLEVREESDFVLSVCGPYEQVFDLAKRSLLACEGKLKKDSIAERYLVGGWKYGINLFGLSVSLELENASGGWIRITAKGFFSDTFDTLGHAKKKARLVVQSLKRLASESTTTTLSVTQPASAPATETWTAAPSSSRQGSSGLATASLVCGILGLLCFGVILGPIAIILGIVAVSQGGPQTGKAWAGITLGIIDLVAGFFLMSVMMSL